jgi:hypothetical protein
MSALRLQDLLPPFAVSRESTNLAGLLAGQGRAPMRNSILSSESSAHPPEPESQSTMVGKRKERAARSAQLRGAVMNRVNRTTIRCVAC